MPTFHSRTATAAAVAAAAIGGVGLASPLPAAAVYAEPVIGFNFGPAQPDLDPSIYVTQKATGPLTFGGAGSGWTKEGSGRASQTEGRISLLYDEQWNASVNSNQTISFSGNASTANLYETLIAGANGSITVTLTGHAVLSKSDVLSVDDSWAGYGFLLSGEVFNPGANTGGGGQASATLDDATYETAASGFTTDVGTPGVRKAIDASFSANAGRDGGTLTLTAWVNTGDRFNFRALAAARGWADHLTGAYAKADLTNTGQLSVSGSPGMSWTSESGVFLSPVPEPAALALLAAGLAVVGWKQRASARARAQAQARR